MSKQPATVAEYLASLPEDRRREVEAIRAAILKNLPEGYEEGIQYGAIGYYIPHHVYPPGYHCDPRQPLPFGGLGSRKGYISFGLMCTYWDAEHEAWFRKAWAASGKKLDMGKVCIRIKRLADAPLDVIGEAVRRVPAKKFIERYEAILQAQKETSAARKAARTAAKAGAAKKSAGGKASAGKSAAKNVAAAKSTKKSTVRSAKKRAT